jgi:hypothetical protein
MRIVQLSLAVAAAIAGSTWLGGDAASQELEPRSYVNTPVGLNFLLAGYGYTQGSVVFSASAPIEDAEVKTHSGFIAFVRSLDVGGMSAKVGAVLPYASADGSAALAGQPQERKISGFGDPKVRLSLNFYGAPALSLKEFAEYEQDLLIGATFEVSAPLGQYDSTKLLNIGTNRWSIKSELGVSKPLGPFTLEASAAAILFTDNSDFLNDRTLQQKPLYAAQMHVVSEFGSGFWGSLDATYYYGGRTMIDGEKSEPLQNARMGLTVSMPVNRYNSIKFFGSTGIYSRTGSDFDAVGAAWQVRWGGGL